MGHAEPACLVATILLFLASSLSSGCLALPYARRGPSEARIESAPSDSRYLLKGRVPYVNLPPISRISVQHLASGVIVRAEARDKVHQVYIHNDTRLELWVRKFHDEGRRVDAIICRDGRPEPMALPLVIPAGEERTLLVRDDRIRRRINMRLTTFLDRDDVFIELSPGPIFSLGLMVIPFSRYDYSRLPSACLDAVRKSARSNEADQSPLIPAPRLDP